MKIRESEEMYLETILLLGRKKSFVRSVDIAAELNYAKPSVSRAVGLLNEKEYISVDKNGVITLTEEGMKRAEDIYERHCILKELLLGMGADETLAVENACRIEHVISPEMFELIKKYVGGMKDRYEKT